MLWILQRQHTQGLGSATKRDNAPSTQADITWVPLCSWPQGGQCRGLESVPQRIKRRQLRGGKSHTDYSTTWTRPLKVRRLKTTRFPTYINTAIYLEEANKDLFIHVKTQPIIRSEWIGNKPKCVYFQKALFKKSSLRVPLRIPLTPSSWKFENSGKVKYFKILYL